MTSAGLAPQPLHIADRYVSEKTNQNRIFSYQIVSIPKLVVSLSHEGKSIQFFTYPELETT